MPIIDFEGNLLICKKGANLRQVLMENEKSPHNGNSRLLNCFGLGTCGTCAVQIIGSVNKMEASEKIRLNLPPHTLETGLRLSCQVKVLSDITVKKGSGFWGQNIKKYEETT